MSAVLGVVLREWINALYDDEALRSNMNDATAAIWLHAASEYLREVSRVGGNVDQAFGAARAGLQAVNREVGAGNGGKGAL
jgi:hypothetical protein